jgi:Helicase HerA, central domain
VTGLSRMRWGYAMVSRTHRDDSWWWLAWSFVIGAPLSTAPAVVGSGSAARALPRLAGLVAAGLGAYAYALADPGSVVRLAWWSWAAAAVATMVAGWQVAEWARGWRHRRRWVRPLEVALRPQLGYPPNMPARAWLAVPRDLADDPDGVRVYLPAGFVGRRRERELIETTVMAKLSLGDVNVAWRLVSRNHFVQFTAKARPPAKVLFHDPQVRAVIERSKASRPVIGLAAGGRPVGVDLDSESPHMAVSAGTGAGKSNMLRVVAAQLMHHGASLVILDLKRRSHRWAKGLDGVTYCREIAEIHRALVELAAEAMDRNIQADRYSDDTEPPWQRRVVIMEELNSTMEELTAYWRDELSEKGASPAVRAYRQLLFMGRAVQVHLLTAAQLFTAQSAGGPAARAQYGTIVMSRFNQRAWKMLLPEITPVPKAGRHPGRGWVALGGEADETQIVFMTERECREWAASGKPSAVAVSRSETDRESQGGSTATVAVPPVLTLVSDEPDDESSEGLVSLWQASVDKGDAWVPLRYDHLRKAAERRRDFPAPVRMAGRKRLYSTESLQRWAANREQTVSDQR